MPHDNRAMSILKLKSKVSNRLFAHRVQYALSGRATDSRLIGSFIYRDSLAQIGLATGENCQTKQVTSVASAAFEFRNFSIIPSHEISVRPIMYSMEDLGVIRY
jgi:hypothetical protein